MTDELTADFTRSLPGGKLDDSTYEAIESALDKADAPMHGDDGRWLSLAERVAAVDAAYGRMIIALNAQLTEQFELSTKYCALWDGHHMALHTVQRYARSDGQRTFDDCIRDLERIDDICRGALK